jgi:hypothetical protein
MRTEGQKRSRIQELKAAQTYQGLRTPGSGNGWVKKGDVRTTAELIELKTTLKHQYPLKVLELKKIGTEALLDGRIPVFIIEFAADHETYVVLDESDYMTMRAKIQDIEAGR